MDRAIEERLSTIVMRAVDSLGYSAVCIRTRRAGYQETLRQYQSDDPLCTAILAGSKAEGTSLLYESDTDMMGCWNNVVCSDNVRNINEAEYKAVFYMDTDNVPAGYTRLKHVDFNKIRRMAFRDWESGYLFRASVQSDSGYYLSSTLMFPSAVCRSGPADTRERLLETWGAFRYKSSRDLVMAFPCQGESMLQDWVKRPRRHGWPSREIIQQIYTLQGHVVPVGCKGSDDEFIQWRICYTPAEITLVHKLNHVQEVLYIVMKMISKQLLKSICSDITSYIIKNMILWMAELLPQHNFTENNLLSVLLSCLKLLRETIRRKYLANYMIPSRNLFSGKIDHQEQQNLDEFLTTMIGQGPQFLLKYPELSRLIRRMQLVHWGPNVARFEQKNREVNEVLSYRTRLDAHADLSRIPLVVPLIHVCLDLGFSEDQIEILLQRMVLYLEGFYYFQHVR